MKKSLLVLSKLLHSNVSILYSHCHVIFGDDVPLLSSVLEFFVSVDPSLLTLTFRILVVDVGVDPLLSSVKF